MSVHVIPRNDEREHLESIDCWCEPWLDGRVIVHNSADCREVSEQVTGERVEEGKEWAVVQVG